MRNIKFSIDIAIEDDNITIEQVKESVEKTTGIYLAYLDRTIEATVALTFITEE